MSDVKKSKETPKMKMRLPIALLSLLACLLTPAAALGAGPVLKVTAISAPTNFAAGSEAPASAYPPRDRPQYIVRVTNIGSAPTKGPIVMADTLPLGISATGATATNFGALSYALPCSASGQTATCTEYQPLKPGQFALMFVAVKVDENTSGTLVGQVSVVGGGAAEVSTTTSTTISGSLPPYGLLDGPSGFSLAATGADGQPATQAGSHPEQLTFDFGFPSGETPSGNVFNAGHPKDLKVELPRGMVVDPTAVPVKCTEAQLETIESNDDCPVASQVGLVFVTTELLNLYPFASPLYAMVPAPGAPAEFAFNALGVGVYVHIQGRLNSAGEYELGTDTESILARQLNPVIGVNAQLWGSPSSPIHDTMRGRPCLIIAADCSRPTKRLDTPLLAMPGSCRSQLAASARTASWEEPGNLIGAAAALEDPTTGAPTPTDGCNKLQFDPSFEAKPTTSLADAPSGLEVDLHVPQSPPVDEAGKAAACSPGIWEGKPTDFSYRWLRNGAPIPGALGPEYQPGEEDAGTLLQCEVTATRAPVALGDLSAGSKAITSAQLFEGDFQRGDEILGAGIPTGTRVLDNSISIGLLELSQAATASASGVTLTSPALAPAFSASAPAAIAPAPGTTAPSPGHPSASASIDDKGGEASCEPGAWGGGPTFAYAWFKDGALVPGQSDATFVVGADEAPLSLQCKVSGTNAGGTAVAYSNIVRNRPLPGATLPEAPLPSPFGAPEISAAQSTTLAAANFKDVRVALPKGLVVNPSSANGQGVCSAAQIGLSTPVGQTPPHFTEAPGACPEAAKIGTVQVNTPLLEEPLFGSVYLAKPFENPFNSLIAIYLDVEDPSIGVVAKLAGRVESDPQTGQLRTTFTENPELPIEDVGLSIFKGPRAPLRTPPLCATHTTTTQITPWSTPEGADAHPSDSFATTAAASGSGNCPTTEAGMPNNPSFTAGTIAPQAGAYSPFVMKLSREDGSQPLAGFEATMPKGLIGKLAGIPYCSEAQIAQAMARNKPNEGAIEQAAPSCPAASEVGTLTVGAGAGITPLYTPGHVYLAPPYKGAPLSLVTITPAIAGPFDLGAVVVRAALRIDPVTAQVKAISDPLPQILDGIPLDIRSIAIKVARPNFILNPTSCAPMSIAATATAALGGAAPLSSPFQVGGCAALPYKPKLVTRLSGPTVRGGHPALKATFTAKAGEAGTAQISFALPHSEFIDQAHFRTICTRVQFAADQCPAGSVYGQVKATTPLLDYPLEGPIYLRSSSNKLPDVVLALKGPPSQPVEVDLAGRVDSVNGGIRTTFEALPDAPVTKAVVSLRGGKKGLFQNSTNTCLKTNRATLKLDGQNGKPFDTRPALVIDGCKKGKGRKGGHRKAGR